MFIRLQDIVSAFKDRQKELDDVFYQEKMGDYEYSFRTSELKHAISYLELIIDELENSKKMLQTRGVKSE